MFLVSVSKQFRIHNPFRIYNLEPKQLNPEILCQFTWRSSLWTCSPHVLRGKEREGNLFMHPVSSLTGWHWDTCKIKKLQWWPSSPDRPVPHFLCCIFYFFSFPLQVWALHFTPLPVLNPGWDLSNQHPLLRAGCSKGRGDCLMCFDLLFVFIHMFQDPKKATCTVFTSYTGILYTAKSLQSCLTLCDPIDGSPPGSPVPGILQARTLECDAISFSTGILYTSGFINAGSVFIIHW